MHVFSFISLCFCFFLNLHPMPALLALLEDDSDDHELMDLSAGRGTEPPLSTGYHESSKFFPSYTCLLRMFYF